MIQNKKALAGLAAGGAFFFWAGLFLDLDLVHKNIGLISGVSTK